MFFRNYKATVENVVRKRNEGGLSWFGWMKHIPDESKGKTHRFGIVWKGCENRNGWWKQRDRELIRKSISRRCFMHHGNKSIATIACSYFLAFLYHNRCCCCCFNLINMLDAVLNNRSNYMHSFTTRRFISFICSTLWLSLLFSFSISSSPWCVCCFEVGN